MKTKILADFQICISVPSVKIPIWCASLISYIHTFFPTAFCCHVSSESLALTLSMRSDSLHYNFGSWSMEEHTDGILRSKFCTKICGKI